MNFQQRLLQSKFLPWLIGAGFLVASILLILASNSLRTDNQTAPEYTPPNALVVLQNSTGLYNAMENSSQLDLLRSDLALFARETIPAYNQENIPEVIFELSDEATVRNNEIEFKGTYDKSGDEILVSLTKLKNSQLKLSIKNTVTGQQIDEKLTANSKRNQYIAKLPVRTRTYDIEYYVLSDSFVIKLRQNEAQNGAIDALRKGLGVNDLSNENISLVPLVEFEDRGRLSPEARDEESNYKINPDDY